MGIPKFFRYISERYPCLSELAREQSMPEFDNLYLDMNGIIHTCSHPNDNDVSFYKSEPDMFKDICNTIDKLFFLIKPKENFFMAVDGVAPRAKMNQQRCRRFQSSKEADWAEEVAKKRGIVRTKARFDSNCITPGTIFMERLHEALQHFVKSKISTDPLWQQCNVYLSGHDMPGEGEHKIMSFIRYIKSKDNYNPNTRHCLYGLDADLIILGMCTHERHFVILRDEVTFGRKVKRQSAEETKFFLLHLGLLREYLQLEFEAIRKIDESFNIANIIDDWVLMSFLVGNDFIPNLPCLHISSNALPYLYDTYIKTYTKLGGNINTNGKLNLERLEIFLEALSGLELALFEENYSNLKYYEAKQSKNGMDDEAFDVDVDDIKNNRDADLDDLIQASEKLILSDDEDEELDMANEFLNYKRNYYLTKLHLEMSSETIHEQAVGYIEALQWILDYYYIGVQSWNWYYPHHYAPFISDLHNFKHKKICFLMGTPFLPFQQLLAVLPAASRHLLPPAYQSLMTEPESEIIEFYPTSFETDLNGKKNDWEAVVLIPFINEKLLLKAMESRKHELTVSEIKRNSHGPMMKYVYCGTSKGSAPEVHSLKMIKNVYCTETKIFPEDVAVSPDRVLCVEMLNPSLTVFFPGYPTIRHLNFEFKLKAGRCKVFNFPSNEQSMFLLPKLRDGHDEIVTVAEKYLNQIVYIGWPHLVRCKVVSVFDSENIITENDVSNYSNKEYNLHVNSVKEHLNSRMAVDFADYSVMCNVAISTGISYECLTNGNVVMKDAWSKALTAYPAQGLVGEIQVAKRLQKYYKVNHFFATNSLVFFIGKPYYGSIGTILNNATMTSSGRIQVGITVSPVPDFAQIKYEETLIHEKYIHQQQAAILSEVPYGVFTRLTGYLLVYAGERKPVNENLEKVNIGAELKLFKSNEECLGYSKRDGNGNWFFSRKSIEFMKEYANRYPSVIAHLSTSSYRSYLFEEELFPNNWRDNPLREIKEWLSTQEHMNAAKIPCGAKVLHKESVEKIFEALKDLKNLPGKTVKLQVKPHLLIKPNVTAPSAYKPTKPVQNFDRIVVVKSTYMVPLGSEGTIIGIYPVKDVNSVRLECVNTVENFFLVLFDKVLPNGGSIYNLADGHVQQVPESSVLVYEGNDNHKARLEFNQNEKESRSKAEVVQRPFPSEPSSEPMENFWIPNKNTKPPKLPVSSAGRREMKSQNNKNENQMYSKKPHEGKNNTPINTSDRREAKSCISNTQNINSNEKQKFLNAMFKQQRNEETYGNVQDGTKVLKNILGIPFENDNIPSTSPKTKTQTYMPPPPPMCWRNDAKMANKLNSPKNNQPQNSNNFVREQNDIHHLKQKVNVNYNHHKNSAFIPLQVMRSNRPRHGEQPSTSTAKPQSNTTEVERRNLCQDHKRDPKTDGLEFPNPPSIENQKKVNLAKISSNETDNIVKKSEPRKKAPRTPKIAASFNNSIK